MAVGRGRTGAGAQWPFFIGILWLGGVLTGGKLLLGYKGQAGDPADAPPTFPLASALRLSSERPTLIMLVHPKCPCTQASDATGLKPLVSQLFRKNSPIGGRTRTSCLLQ